MNTGDSAGGKPNDKPNGKSNGKNGKGKVHPNNARVPEDVLKQRPAAEDAPHGQVTTTAAVHGNQAIMIIDNRNSRPIKVSLVEGMGLTPDLDGRLVFVESNVIHDLMSVDAAQSKFAIKKDGTIIYGQQGFDDVPGEVQMIDIVKLIEFNNSAEGKALNKKADDALAKADKEAEEKEKKDAAEAKKKAEKDAKDAKEAKDK